MRHHVSTRSCDFPERLNSLQKRAQAAPEREVAIESEQIFNCNKPREIKNDLETRVAILRSQTGVAINLYQCFLINSLIQHTSRV